MKKVYINKQTGLVLELDGPVLCCSDGSKLNIGDAQLADELGKFLAQELGADLVRMEEAEYEEYMCMACAQEPAIHDGLCGSCMSAQPALFYDLETGRVL